MAAGAYTLTNQGAGTLNLAKGFNGGTTGQLVQNGPGNLILSGSGNVTAKAIVVNGGEVDTNLSGGAKVEGSTAISVNSGGALLLDGGNQTATSVR